VQDCRSASLQLNTLQDHLVTTDNACVKVAAIAANQAIGHGVRLGATGPTSNNDFGFIDHQFCVHGDRAGRRHWPGIAQQVCLNSGQRTYPELDSLDAISVTIGRNRPHLVQDGQAYGQFVHLIAS
jgi:hypothetical protein